MKTYKKLADAKFNVSEVKELSSDIDALEQLANLAGQISAMKKLVATAQDMKAKFKQTAERYNQRAEILNDAKKECDLDYKEVPVLELPEEFVLEDFDISTLPVIDIHRDESKKD